MAEAGKPIDTKRDAESSNLSYLAKTDHATQSASSDAFPLRTTSTRPIKDHDDIASTPATGPSVPDQLAGSLQTTANDLQAGLSDAVSDVGTQVTNGVDAVKTDLSSLGGTAQSTARDVVEQVQADAGTLASRVKIYGRDLFDDAVRISKDAADDVKDTVDDVADQEKPFIDAAKRHFAAGGKDVESATSALADTVVDPHANIGDKDTSASALSTDLGKEPLSTDRDIKMIDRTADNISGSDKADSTIQDNPAVGSPTSQVSAYDWQGRFKTLSTEAQKQASTLKDRASYWTGQASEWSKRAYNELSSRSQQAYTDASAWSSANPKQAFLLGTVAAGTLWYVWSARQARLAQKKAREDEEEETKKASTKRSSTRGTAPRYYGRLGRR